MKTIIVPPASGERRRKVPVIGTRFVMEREALILRARAEHAKLAALYAADETERSDCEGRARAYEAHARELEDSLDGWRI
jgi:hypothetical protein